MAASSNSTTPTSLQILVSPTSARPSQDSLVHALQECTRFRLHHCPDSAPEAPHFAQVEFENEVLAKKAFATVQGVSLQGGSTLYLRPVQPGLGNGNDAQEPTMPDPPKGSKLLNVTELPPEYTAGQCYDVFAKFGHIFSCIQTAKGTCQVIFYSSADAETAQTEMNFSNLGTYQIIVRFPSKYDQKDSFKAGRGVSTAAASRPARRTVSEKVSSNGSLRQQSSTMHRSASGPIRITDPIRLIVQNVPLALKAPDLFSHFESYGNLQTAALAYDQSSGSRKPLGIAVLVYTTPEEASRALQALNGQFLQPLEGQTADMYRALQPLYIRLWEPRGDIEKATAFEEPVKAGTNLQANAKPFVTGTPSTSVDTPDRREVSFSSSSSTVVSPSGSRIVDSSNGTIDLTPDLKKHRRLLATALEDLPLSLRNEIGGYLKRPDVVADVLVRQLQDEGERKRCIFDEAFLMTKLREALPLLEKEGDTSKGDSSPTRLYERGKLLQGESQLYSPMATTAPALEEVAAVITSPSGSGSPTLPRSRSRSHSPTTRIGTSAPTAEMSMDTLSRFSAAGIIALARSPAPPTVLSRPLNTSEEAWSAKILAVEAFLQSIEILKPNLQKQKLGEKIFKLLKVAAVKNLETGQMETMKNISKRTVALLDGEVLSALAHLCEEFPDVLVAKAAAADV